MKRAYSSSPRRRALISIPFSSSTARIGSEYSSSNLRKMDAVSARLMTSCFGRPDKHSVRSRMAQSQSVWSVALAMMCPMSLRNAL